uniref:Uncharacterized protein n=1 Tax=unidentified TaxID=32644 RepID=A0A6G9W250_9ZZZZ|nr:hypothetical protein [unidentified]
MGLNFLIGNVVCAHALEGGGYSRSTNTRDDSSNEEHPITRIQILSEGNTSSETSTIRGIIHPRSKNMIRRLVEGSRDSSEVHQARRLPSRHINQRPRDDELVLSDRLLLLILHPRESQLHPQVLQLPHTGYSSRSNNLLLPLGSGIEDEAEEVAVGLILPARTRADRVAAIVARHVQAVSQSANLY